MGSRNFGYRLLFDALLEAHFILSLLCVTACLVVLFAVPPARGENEGAGKEQKLFRVALSKGTFGKVNRNDAQAAIMAWAKTILKQQDINIEAETHVYDRIEDLVIALRNKEFDAAGVLTSEFQGLEAKPASVILNSKNGIITEKYILLVRRNSGIVDIKDVRGRKFVMYKHPSTSLASAWLDTLLSNRSIGLSTEVFSKTILVENASNVVLQVFFGQADMCLITAGVFEVACELNPQLKKELRVLAESPELIPTLFFFRPGYTSVLLEKMERAIVKLHESPAGQQVLTIFQGDRLEKQPVSCLKNSLNLLEEAEHLRPPGTLNDKHKVL